MNTIYIYLSTEVALYMIHKKEQDDERRGNREGVKGANKKHQ